jgi:hypothetical protein
MQCILNDRDLRELIHDAEKARRRERYEHRVGRVHLRGGVKKIKAHGTRHRGGRRPAARWQREEW